MTPRGPAPVVAVQATRFAVSGLLVTALHVVVATTLIRFASVAPPLANGMAFTTATIFSYLINTMWSFSSRLHGRTLVRFCLVSLVGLALAVGVSGTAQHFRWSYGYGVFFVVCCVPPVTFLLHKFWTYR